MISAADLQQPNLALRDLQGPFQFESFGGAVTTGSTEPEFDFMGCGPTEVSAAPAAQPISAEEELAFDFSGAALINDVPAVDASVSTGTPVTGTEAKPDSNEPTFGVLRNYEHVDRDVRLDELVVNSKSVIHIAGIQHILHKCTEAMMGAMGEWDTYLEQVKSLCCTLRRPYSRDRLQETCFNQEPQKHQWHLFEGFHASVIEHRWGTIAEAVTAVLHVETPLRYAWSLRNYNHGRAKPPPPTEKDAQYRINMENVDTAIRSDKFWAYTFMTSLLVDVVNHMQHWVMSSPFKHDSEVFRELTRASRQAHLQSEEYIAAVAGDPMSGRLAPEVATGTLHDIMNSLWDVSLSALLMDASVQRLSEAERASILGDFNAGRSLFTFYFTVKMSVWRTLPLVALGLAACDQDRARIAGEMVLDFFNKQLAFHDHPFVKAVCADLTALRSFIDGGPMSSDLEDAVASARFHLINEGPIEGLHAHSNRTISTARNFKGVHMALSHHLSSIRNFVGSAQARGELGDHLEELAHACNHTNRSDRCLEMLNIDKHPVISDMVVHSKLDIVSRSRYRPTVIKVIYHCDAPSLHCDSSDMPAPIVPEKTIANIEEAPGPVGDLWGSILHSAMVQHIRMLLTDGEYDFMLVPVGQLSALKDTLLTPLNVALGAPEKFGCDVFKLSGAPVAGDGAETREDTRGPFQDCDEWIALSVVHMNSSQLKHSKYSQHHLTSQSIVVAAHNAEHVAERASCEWMVFVDPITAEHHVLNLDKLECSVLSQLSLAKHGDSIRMKLPLRYLPSVAAHDRDKVDDVLTKMCFTGAALGGQRYAVQSADLGSDESWRLASLESFGLVSRSTSGSGPTYWQLTGQGVQSCSPCRSLCPPVQAIAARDNVNAFKDMDVLELLLQLEKSGFVPHQRGARQQVPPYEPHVEGSPKVFYIRHPLNANYLRALLLGVHVVHHGKAAEHYKSIVEHGRVLEAKPNKRKAGALDNFAFTSSAGELRNAHIGTPQQIKTRITRKSSVAVAHAPKERRPRLRVLQVRRRLKKKQPCQPSEHDMALAHDLETALDEANDYAGLIDDMCSERANKKQRKAPAPDTESAAPAPPHPHQARRHRDVGPKSRTVDKYPRLVMYEGSETPTGRPHVLRCVNNPLVGGGRTNSILAVCGWHENCYTSKTLNASATRPAQGRPLGLLWSWLEDASSFASKELHVGAILPRTRGVCCDLDRRVAARDLALTHVALLPPADQEYWDTAERPTRPGEGDEPTEVP